MPKNSTNKVEEWWEINTFVNSLILNTIEPHLRSIVNYSERPDKLCVDLKERFLEGNAPRKYKLKAVVANCKQGGDTMNVYYLCQKKIWDKLQNYSQLPVREVGSILAREREEEQIYQFLIGLKIDIYIYIIITFDRVLFKSNRCQIEVDICKDSQGRAASLSYSNSGDRRGRCRYGFCNRDESFPFTDCSKSKALVSHCLKLTNCYKLVRFPDR